MTDPVEALAAALEGHTDPKDGRIVPPLVEDEAVRGGWRYAGPNEFAAELLRASGFDVVPTGEPEWDGSVSQLLDEWVKTGAPPSRPKGGWTVPRVIAAIRAESAGTLDDRCAVCLDAVIVGTDGQVIHDVCRARLSSSDTGGRG